MEGKHSPGRGLPARLMSHWGGRGVGRALGSLLSPNKAVFFLVSPCSPGINLKTRVSPGDAHPDFPGQVKLQILHLPPLTNLMVTITTY